MGKEVNPDDDGTRCLLDDANNVGDDEWIDDIEFLEDLLAVTISRKPRFGLFLDDDNPLTYEDDDAPEEVNE